MTTKVRKGAQPAGTPEPKLVRPAVAAARYGVDHRTVRDWVYQGKIQGYRLGQRVMLVDENEIAAMLVPIPRPTGSR